MTVAVVPAWTAATDAAPAAPAALDGVTVEVLARRAAAAGLAPRPDVPITYAI